MESILIEKEIERLNRIKRNDKFPLPALIIDDDQWTRRLIARYLSDWGLNPIFADNPITGLSLAIKHRPILIFLDIYLPEINGNILLKMFKEIEITKDIPVAIMSANLSKDLLSETYQNGAASFISKPFQEDLLKETVKKCIDVKLFKNGGSS